MIFEVKYDLRNPPPWRRPPVELYRDFLEQVAWADEQGFDRVYLHEHHFAEDGYLPSPLTAAAAIAARTARIRICVFVLAPLKHPVQLAEELALIDVVSGGRLELHLGLGYRTQEYDGYGIAMADRVGRLEETVEILRRCFHGERFDHDGRHFRLRGVDVQPRPVQPDMPIVLGGSSVAAARRAARIADQFVPPLPEHYDAYLRELDRLGRPRPTARMPGGRSSEGFPRSLVHVARDPVAAWAVVGSHALWESTVYAQWAAERGNAVHTAAADPDELLRRGTHAVLTPEELVSLGREVERTRTEARMCFHPLVGGLPTAVGRECLELVAAEVMPAFR